MFFLQESFLNQSLCSVQKRSFLCLKICSLINEVFVFTPNIFGIYNFELACCSLLLHTFEKIIFHFYLLILFTHLVFIYFETFTLIRLGFFDIKQLVGVGLGAKEHQIQKS